MALLLNLPRTSWLKRLSVFMALALVGLGVALLAGRLLDVEALMRLHNHLEPMKANAAVGLILFGVTLLLIEMGVRRAAWAAIGPGLLGGLALLEQVSGLSLGVGDLIIRDNAATASPAPSQMSPMLAGTFLVAGCLIAWLAVPGPFARMRTPALALFGSVMVAIGFSTILGYELRLPAIYSWSTPTLTAPLIAFSLLVFGCALMLLALRESLRNQPGAPPWLPLPVIVASATLTLIFALGLRGREIEYQGINTEIELNSFASAINQELSRQITTFDRLARSWSHEPEITPTVREVDATNKIADSPGCHAIALLDLQHKQVWIYPVRGNETAAALVHSNDPVRAQALETVRKNVTPILSGSTTSPDVGPGFVIYAPVLKGGRLHGFVAGEFTYRLFLTAVDQRNTVSDNYHCSVEVGSTRMYDSRNGSAAGRPDAIEKVFTLHDRRVRISLAPTDTFLTHSRRFLPELALASGFGITFLLGLSVHLARTARSGLRAAETSNKRLIAENEERRRVEAMLKIADERLRLALDSTQIGIFEWQLEANRVYYSPGVWTMLGYDPSKQSPTIEAWIDLVHRADLSLYKATWGLQVRGEKPFIDPEYRVRAADGSWRWVYVRSRALAAGGGAGPPSRIIGTIQDVTEHKVAEQALRESQAATRKLSMVAARTDNLVIIVTPEGAIEWVNESFERILEYSLAEVAGRDPQPLITGPETNPRVIRRIKAALARGEGISTDLVNYSKSGRKYHMNLEIQPVRNEEGALENFIAIEADITARVETEKALRRAKAEADEASRAKSEFLASMSHEIRTPMNGVIGMTSLLLETPLDTEQREYLNTIRVSGEALLTIINDILDFSKIESGHMDLELHPIDLYSCIEESLDLFAVLAASKKLELAYCIHEDVPNWVLGDITRLRQVLVNLINNGVKFTSQGSVSVEVSRVPAPAGSSSDAEGMILQFSVRDTGIGIPAERIDRLFKPFSQVDSSTTRKYGGTGLGLAICHRLVALMGGEIHVESERGAGSNFIFTITTKPAPEPDDHEPLILPAMFRGRPILCIEDHPLIERRLVRLFRDLGALPLSARTSSEASAALASLARRKTPAAVLVDVPMLDSADGAGLREQISALRMPTILVLAPGQSATTALGDRRYFATASKPLKTQSILRALRSLAASNPGSGETPAAPSPLAPTTATAPADDILAKSIPLHVLIVEDNPVNQRVAVRFMERLGYRVETVANGLEAVSAVEAGAYDLVFMDLQMPEMDGFEASREIRRRLPSSRQPKIVALTANALQGDRELCLAAGMDDYITKPVKLQEMVAVIRKQFSDASPFEKTAQKK